MERNIENQMELVLRFRAFGSRAHVSAGLRVTHALARRRVRSCGLIHTNCTGMAFSRRENVS